MSSDPRRIYATYFDFGYLAKGLTLVDSLRAHNDKSTVWILCLDDQTHEFLTRMNIQNVRLLQLKQLEEEHPELSVAKKLRSRAEYIFTVGPTFLLDLLRTQTRIGDVLVYVDADLYFFDSPNRVALELSEASVGIIEHRYPKRLQRKLSRYGRFNVGWVGFRNDSDGSSVLSWWAKECIKWCFDKPENGKYADQGYLNDFVSFPGVRILSNPGFNLAPWNTMTHRVESAVENRVEVDGQQLTFFHFHGIKETKHWFITSQLVYRSPANKTLRRSIYAPYLSNLQTNQAFVSGYFAADLGHKNRRGRGLRGSLFFLGLQGIALLSIVTGNAIRKQPPQGSEKKLKNGHTG